MKTAHTGPGGLPSSSSASASTPRRTPGGADEEPVQRKRWHDEHEHSVMEAAATRQTLQGISSARLPTDVDRPRQQQEEEAHAFKVGVLKASVVTTTEPTPALLLALYGTLLTRYTRDPEMVIGLLDKGSVLGVPLHSVLGQEGLPLSSTIAALQSLLDAAQPLSQTKNLTTQAFHLPLTLVREEGGREGGVEGGSSSTESTPSRPRQILKEEQSVATHSSTLSRDSETESESSDESDGENEHDHYHHHHQQQQHDGNAYISVAVADSRPATPTGSSSSSSSSSSSIASWTVLPRDWPLLVLGGKGGGASSSLPSSSSSSSTPMMTGGFDLYLAVDEDEEGRGDKQATYTLAYNATLFSPLVMEAFLRSFSLLLEQASSNQHVAHDALPVIAATDAHLLLHTYNNTATSFPSSPPPSSLHSLFEAQADKHPHRIAVVGPSLLFPPSLPPSLGASPSLQLGEASASYTQGWVDLTYTALDQKANALAQYLVLEAGVKKGEIMGILLERSADFYVAMLGVLKAGGAYLSLDPSYPADRIAFILEDAGARLLVTTTVLAGAAAVGGGNETHGAAAAALHLFCLDDAKDAALLAAQPTTRVVLSEGEGGREGGEKWCYVIYTSGSTGKPKGVPISHINALNLVLGEEMIYSVLPSDRVLQGFSTSFDASVEEIWMAFHSGAALVVGTKEIMQSGPDFAPVLHALRISCLSTVPTLLATIPEAASSSLPSSSSIDPLPLVRLLITGGEACSKELVERWAALPSRRFFNTYGPTEATVIATYKECEAGREGRVTIGRPLPNYTCYVVDAHMHLLPPGAIGELVIGGPSVCKAGYLNLPEKTASVFLPDTLAMSDYPLYRSGDLVRLNPEGEIEYMGRADSQVKLSGYRVELGEIEGVLCESLPGVANAVVVVQTDPGGRKHLVAFLVPSDPLLLATIDMHSILRSKLPTFMVPAYIEILPSLPTLPSGKVDRRQLPHILTSSISRLASTSSSFHPGDTSRSGRRGLSMSTSRRSSISNGGDGEAEGEEEGGEEAPLLPSRPFTAAEAIVAAEFEKLLGLDEGSLGGMDPEGISFFELGGNSLLVSHLVTRLRAGGVPGITTRDVYQNGTVEELGVVVAGLQAKQVLLEKKRGVLEGERGVMPAGWVGGSVATAITSSTVTSSSYASSLSSATSSAVSSPTHAGSSSRERVAAAVATALPPYAVPKETHIPSRISTIIADVVQTLCMYLIAAFLALELMTIYFLYFDYRYAFSLPVLCGVAALASVGVMLALALICLFAKWTLLGKVKEGAYPLWGGYHLRWWFVSKLDGIFRGASMWVLGGTPLFNVYLRGMGSKVGREVWMNGEIEGYDLITVEDGVIFNSQAVVSAVAIENQHLVLRKVHIGKQVTLGIRVVVEPGVIIGAGASISDMTVLPSGTIVPPLEAWGGSPGIYTGEAPLPPSSLRPVMGRGLQVLQFVWGMMSKFGYATLTILSFEAAAYAVVTREGLKEGMGNYAYSFLELTWLFTLQQLVFFAVVSLVVAGLRRVMLVGMGEKTSYPIDSFLFLRRWCIDSVMASLDESARQIRGTLFLPLWWQLMGWKMGKQSEISSHINLCPDRVVMGNNCFIADDITMGLPSLHASSGMVSHEYVTIGERAFVGNDTVVPEGSQISDDMLVGLQSLAPKRGEAGETFIGVPPFKIQRVHANKKVKDEEEGGGEEAAAAAAAALAHARQTYAPPMKLKVVRAVMEGGGYLILQLVLGAKGALFFATLNVLPEDVSWAGFLAFLPLLMILHVLFAFVAVFLVKRLVVGKFKAGTYPLYNTRIWAIEFFERMEESVLMVDTDPYIWGSIYAKLVLQAMGMKVGKRPYLDAVEISEYDQITLGDYVTMDKKCGIQTHLFQDRVRTIGPVVVGNHVALGFDSIVLLGAKVGDHAVLGSQSLVMRYEELPPNTKWHGIPAQPAE